MSKMGSESMFNNLKFLSRTDQDDITASALPGTKEVKHVDGESSSGINFDDKVGVIVMKCRGELLFCLWRVKLCFEYIGVVSSCLEQEEESEGEIWLWLSWYISWLDTRFCCIDGDEVERLDLGVR